MVSFRYQIFFSQGVTTIGSLLKWRKFKKWLRKILDNYQKIFIIGKICAKLDKFPKCRHFDNYLEFSEAIFHIVDILIGSRFGEVEHLLTWNVTVRWLGSNNYYTKLNGGTTFDPVDCRSRVTLMHASSILIRGSKVFFFSKSKSSKSSKSTNFH